MNGVSPSRLAARRFEYNSAGRLVTEREGDVTAAGAFTERARWAYGYDARGQVAAASALWADGAAVSGLQFGTAGANGAVSAPGYIFDAIGNRTATLRNGSSSNHSVNSLNQVTQRVGGTERVDLLGEADPLAAVRVNGTLVPAGNRHGVHFDGVYYQSMGPDYAAPHWTTLTVREEKPGTPPPAPTVVSGGVYVPAYAESQSYDLDGNQLTDGRWSYGWDGENRLVAMLSRWDATPTTGMPKEKLAFKYDSEGRRTVKEYYTRTAASGTGSTWVLQRRMHFRYEGWNLIAEYSESLNPPPSTLNLVRSYAWGEDLSGSLQGAGGVGGLVLVSVHAANGTIQSYWPAMDNVGNVHALINLLNGEVAAEYEYGPFGEPLRVSGLGTVARENPFRFSTKYCDEESGLSYYGYRFYDPMKGRWLSRDPLADEKFLLSMTGTSGDKEKEGLRGESLQPSYLFTRNHPTSYVDVHGLVVIGIYGFGPADDVFWLHNPSNKIITRIATSTGGFAYGRSQDGSIRQKLREALQQNPREPIVLFGYSRGGIKIKEIAEWILGRQAEFPCPRIFLVGMDPVRLAGSGPIRIPDGVEEWTNWFQKNGGLSLNLGKLNGTPYTGGNGTNIAVVAWPSGTPYAGTLVFHAAMPVFLEEDVVAKINEYKRR